MSLTSVDLAHAMGRNLTVVWRWLKVIDHPAPGQGHAVHDLTHRQGLAIYVGHLIGRTELGKLTAHSIATTSCSWLYVRVGLVLMANTPEELLRSWTRLETPPGLVLNLDRLSDDLRRALVPKSSPTNMKELGE